MMSWVETKPSLTDSTILYICACMGLGGIIRYLLKNFAYDKVRFPYSAVLLIIGILFGVITLTSDTLKDISVLILKLNAFDLAAIVFPPFIFKTAFQMDIHIFLKSFSQILTISTLGFSFSCVIIGFFTAYITGKEWPIVSALLFGLIASLTDTKDTNKFLGTTNTVFLVLGTSCLHLMFAIAIHTCYKVIILLGQFKNLGVLLAGEEMITSSLSMFLYDLLVHMNDGPLKADPASVTFFKVAVPVVTGLITGKLFVYFVSWDRCDFYTNITASLFVSYSMIYLVEIFLGASGILTLLVFGIIVCCNKRQIASDLEQSLVQFWELLYNLFNFILYIEAGILLVHASESHGEGGDIVRVFITYLICLVTRSLMLLILSPILTRIGYGFNWKNGVVLVWGALKGTATIVLASCIYLDSHVLGDFSHKAMIYAVGLVLMQLIINGTTLKKMVKFLGFTTVSVVKISNMNNIILYVMSARDRSINMLKMNRLFADASWDTVRSATKIVHPYKDSFTEEGNCHEDEDKGFGFSKCPDCKKEVPLQPTPKEMREIKKEAYLRILKAKKVSYWRQYEWGMMTKEANRTLIGTVDDALEKNSGMVDVDALRNLWKPKGCTVNLRNRLVQFMPKNNPNVHLKAPLRRYADPVRHRIGYHTERGQRLITITGYWELFLKSTCVFPEMWQFYFYKVVSSLQWEYITFLLVILNIISIILDFIYRPAFEKVPEIALVVISTVFFVLLIMHTFLKILGVGCYNFMRSVWHFIDMLTIIITIFYIFYVYKYYLSQNSRRVTHIILLSLSGSRGIYVFRLLRICDVVRATIPKIVEYLDRKIDVRLAHGYDVGKGFVTGENEVLKLLPKFIGNKKILAEIKIKMEADRLAITKEIGILQRNRPTIAITVKTREAMGAVLHVMKETTKELRDGGLLDDEEYQLLLKVIEERQKLIRKRYLSISPCPPDVLLRQVPWVIDDEETANFLVTHSLMVNLNYEEILIRADEEPQGIYVLVSGLVRMTYESNIKKLEKLEQCGALPNVDYPTGMNYRENQEDYIVSGNVIGEIGILTGRTYDARITCESSVQAYFISIDVMNYAMKSQIGNYGGLEQRIWKAVSVRLACIILPAVPAYQSWTQERIQIHLERAFVPKLIASKTFILSDIMEAVLLIEGRALDVVNKDVYFAPSYIPRTVRKLTFASGTSNPECCVGPILLIVPAEDVDEQELMEYIEGDSEPSSRSSFIHTDELKWKTRYKKPKKQTKRNTAGFNKLDKYSGGVRAIKAESAHIFDEGQISSRTAENVSPLQRIFDREADGEEEIEEPGDVEEDEEEIDFKKRKGRRYYHFEEHRGKKKGDTERDEVAYERDSTKSSYSELSEDDQDPGSYTLSYFNYKPLYNLDLDELDRDEISISSTQTDINDSATDGRGKRKADYQRKKKDSMTGEAGTSEVVLDTDERAVSDNTKDHNGGSSPRPETSKSVRNRIRRWFE